MARRRHDSQNFDSLLDTMANVVGILVVVMAFTQIHVGEAVRRIDELAKSGALPVIPAIDSAPEGGVVGTEEALQHELRRLERDWRRLESSAAFTRKEIAQIEPQLAKLDALNPGYAGPHRGEHQLEAELARRSRELAESERELARARKTRSRLEIQLSDAEARPAAMAHQVRLPDPRPAPHLAVELSVFVRQGQLGVVELEKLKQELETAVRSWRTSPRINDTHLRWNRVDDYFNDYAVGDRYFRWRLKTEARGQVAVHLEWLNPDFGETIQEIEAADSSFRQELARRTPRSRYLNFYVWSDSYETYLRAREIAEGLGYSVGWQEVDAGEEFGGFLVRHASRDPVPVD